jgi:hypothetical protein
VTIDEILASQQIIQKKSSFQAENVMQICLKRSNIVFKTSQVNELIFKELQKMFCLVEEFMKNMLYSTV